MPMKRLAEIKELEDKRQRCLDGTNDREELNRGNACKPRAPKISSSLLPKSPQPTSSRLPRTPKKKKFDLLKFKSWFRTAKNLPKHLQIWQGRKEWYQIDNVLEAIQIYEEGL